MNEVRGAAFRLRLAGRSYNEIQRQLGTPKSTLSGWFKHIALSDKAQARLTSRTRLGSATLIKRNKMQTHNAERRAREMHAIAKKEIPKLTKRDLLIIGTVLYWAEGYKRLMVRDGKERMSHRISFLNTDSVMISAFTQFLQKELGVPKDKIRLTMRLYPHINEVEARRYWIQATGLSTHNFQKATAMISGASKGRRPHNRLPFGTLEVAVNDTVKFHYLLGLIEGVKERMRHGKIASSPG